MLQVPSHAMTVACRPERRFWRKSHTIPPNPLQALCSVCLLIVDAWWIQNHRTQEPVMSSSKMRFDEDNAGVEESVENGVSDEGTPMMKQSILTYFHVM